MNFMISLHLDFFDRYIASLGNQCDGNLALLTSLTTLYCNQSTREEENNALNTHTT